MRAIALILALTVAFLVPLARADGPSRPVSVPPAIADLLPAASAPVSQRTPIPAVEQIAACCKVCRAGKACGNSCISRSKTCHRPPGCACDG